MRKAQVHFSNHLEGLLEELKENLFPLDSSPFERRLIAVPHLNLKSYLMQSIAKDPAFQVAAGLQIVSLSQCFSKITRKILPGAPELSLFLQHHLIPLIKTEEELKSYFAAASKEKRIGPFCDALALYFQRYAIYGKKELSGWQEKLWIAMKRRWSFPGDPLSVSPKWHIHLFGFSFIPKTYLDFFLKADATLYLFSPCEIFWGDFYSEKERNFITKDLSDPQFELFDQTFEDQNPILANWGKVGRKTLNMIEERNLITAEHYVTPPSDSSLHKLQRDLLGGANSKLKKDETLSFISASTPYREVEILKDQLLKLFEGGGIEPRDVQVFAPDIRTYAPYIHTVFNDIAYAISDLTLLETDPLARAFAKLVELPKKRFALEDVLQLFSMAPFKQKWDINIGQTRKWLELANVRWGLSKQQRLEIYLQDIEEKDISVNPGEGTWEEGLNRLILGLGQMGVDALCAIESTEMENFDRLYTIIHSLSDDLAPLYDGTKWTIPTWLRYFGCLLESYFEMEPGHELYEQFIRLASSCDHLDQEEIAFTSIERVIADLLSKKGKSHHPPHLQSIRFGSLSEGCAQPGKVICLLGMQEEAFPGREENGSLYVGESDYRPKRGDQDRYLILQLLFSASSFFLMSYVRDVTNKWGPSPLLQQLLTSIEGAEIVQHPAEPFDPKYFQGENELFSYSQEYFEMAQKSPMKAKTLIKGFYEPISLISSTTVKDIDIQKLFKFAKHPLRYYLHEKLKIYPESTKPTAQREYVLDPLSKHRLVQDSLKSSPEEVLERAERCAELPINLLKALAKQQVTDEVEEWHEAIAEFGIDRSEICTKKINMQVGKFRLVGKLDFFTSKGCLAKGKNSFEDRIKFWPQAKLLEQLGLPLLFIKDRKSFLPKEGSLEKYIEYFLLSEEHPSPLLPEFAKALLQGKPAELNKAIKQAEDEIWNWFLLQDQMPSPEVIHRNWSSYLQEVFDAKV